MDSILKTTEPKLIALFRALLIDEGEPYLHFENGWELPEG
jgi:hypothetical protein